MRWRHGQRSVGAIRSVTGVSLRVRTAVRSTKALARSPSGRKMRSWQKRSSGMRESSSISSPSRMKPRWRRARGYGRQKRRGRGRGPPARPGSRRPGTRPRRRPPRSPARRPRSPRQTTAASSAVRRPRSVSSATSTPKGSARFSARAPPGACPEGRPKAIGQGRSPTHARTTSSGPTPSTGGHAALDRRAEQRRRVAVADDRLRLTREPAQVEAGEEPLASVAAARAEDRPHAGIVDHLHEVDEALLVAPRQVRLSLQHRAPYLDAQPPALEHRHPRAQALTVDGARGCDHADHVSAPDPGRLADRRALQLRAEIPAAPHQVKSFPCKSSAGRLGFRHAAVSRTDRAGGREPRQAARAGPAARARRARGDDTRALRRDPRSQLRGGGGDRARGERRGRAPGPQGRPGRPPRGPRPAPGRAAREAAHRTAAGVRAVTLSEARLSFLSHALLKAVTGEKLGRIRNERLFLAEAKRGLTEGFSLDGRLDQLARARMPKRVVPGSREWDVLYRRYYEEERRKLGG